MSVKVMGMVFDAAGFTPTEKLVLLALSDHASHDGMNIYPSVETICRKTSLTDRTVRRVLASLRSDDRNILFLVKRRGRFQNEYGLNLDKLQELTHDQVSDSRPDTRSGQELIVDPPRPDTGSAKPSVEPSPEPSGESAARPRPRDLLFDAIAEACAVDPATAGSSIASVKKALLQAKPPYTPDEVRRWRATWPTTFKTPPTLWQLKERIGQVRATGNGKPATKPGEHAYDPRPEQAQAEYDAWAKWRAENPDAPNVWDDEDEE